MAGTRQFDTQQVLDDALVVFWDVGYEAASITDLTEATGLGRGSLYGAFKNKEGLFLAVLDHYLERSRLDFFNALENSDLLAAIKSAFDVFIKNLTSEFSQSGCLLVLAAENSEIKSKRIRKKVVQAFSDEEQAFYDRLKRAKEEDLINPALDLRSLARFLSAQTRALGITARISSDPQALRDIVDVVLQSLALLIVKKDS